MKFVVKPVYVEGASSFAVTCAAKENNKGLHIICFPEVYNKCRADILIRHELIHAKQACTGTLQTKTRAEIEEEAYADQMREHLRRQCTAPDNFEKIYNTTLENAVDGSTGGNVKLFDSACEKLRKEEGN